MLIILSRLESHLKHAVLSKKCMWRYLQHHLLPLPLWLLPLLPWLPLPWFLLLLHLFPPCLFPIHPLYQLNSQPLNRRLWSDILPYVYWRCGPIVIGAEHHSCVRDLQCHAICHRSHRCGATCHSDKIYHHSNADVQRVFKQYALCHIYSKFRLHPGPNEAASAIEYRAQKVVQLLNNFGYLHDLCNEVGEFFEYVISDPNGTMEICSKWQSWYSIHAWRSSTYCHPLWFLKWIL